MKEHMENSWDNGLREMERQRSAVEECTPGPSDAEDKLPQLFNSAKGQLVR